MVEAEAGGTVKKTLATYLDVCFVLDGTGSMDLWIESVKVSLDLILGELGGAFVKTACVIYRDFPPKFEIDIPEIPLPDLKDYKQIEVFDFVKGKDIQQVKDFLGKVKCEHGWDRCEDMRGGLDAALKLNWTGQKDKFIVVVTDSPTHGKLFNCGKLDDFPDEDKEMTKTLEKIKKENFNLVALQIQKDTAPMFSKFKEILGDNLLVCDLDFNKEVDKEKRREEYEAILKETIKTITKAVTGSIKRKYI